MHKPNAASRQWNQKGFELVEGHQRAPQQSIVRRCGRCEADDANRVRNGLSALNVPAHHEDEHFDNQVRYGRTHGERGGRVSPNIPQDVVGSIGGRQ
jgi:hypothetical protein